MKFPLTNQEIFDAAYKGVMAQGNRCVNEKGKCVYLGPNNQRCAASHVFAISDPNVSLKRFKSSESSGIVMRHFGYLDEKADAFIRSLQDIHDSAGKNEKSIPFIDHYHQDMVDFAHMKGLTIPEVV
tara:strand:+ start:1915 stop:2295 length:381 start_codon:yes stop_codon:yes gene_type:complete